MTAPALAAEAARHMLEDDSLSWLMDELAEALLGDPRRPGDPALRPLARRCARTALAGTCWSDALPALTELEPEAVLAVHARLRELGALEPR
ncbi:hypothetical protein [Streptomyces sp. UG1]|uniref:hypothetical protein n=1 Tax=Streptomyces sp. UG1 TaxID=3417652 RepID=UPI003CF9EC80